MTLEVYYRIYLCTRTQKFAVVEMQDFDEGDYAQHRFLKDADGEALHWESEEEAIRYLNRVIKPEHIEEQWVSAGNRLFSRRPNDPV